MEGEKMISDLRIKFYAKWKEFIKEQAVDPDQPRYLHVSYIQFWFRLVRVGLNSQLTLVM
jgi:hypothetical protein